MHKKRAPSEARFAHFKVVLISLFLDACIGSVLLNRLDTVLQTGSISIHLARTNNLPVSRLQVEVNLSIGGLLALKHVVVSAVLLNGLNAVHTSVLTGVSLAGENHLSIAGYEIETILACGVGAYLELAHFIQLLFSG